jgi:hypothetical protein
VIKILDDALPKEIFAELQSIVMRNPRFVYGVTETAYTGDTYKSLSASIEDQWQKQYFTVLLQMMGEKAGIKIGKVFRVRVGLIHRDIQQVVNGAHIDQLYPHKVGLLYLNNTDGTTKIYNETADFNQQVSISATENLSVDREIECLENRIVFFDGARYHSSTTPMNTQLRYAVNFNFSGE